jgi:hypothetical protein
MEMKTGAKVKGAFSFTYFTNNHSRQRSGVIVCMNITLQEYNLYDDIIAKYFFVEQSILWTSYESYKMTLNYYKQMGVITEEI